MANKEIDHAREMDIELQKKLPAGVRLLRTFRGHTGSITQIAWSPDGRTLASPSEDCSVRLWDAFTGHLTRMLTDHRETVVKVCFNTKGTLLASAGGEENTDTLDAEIRLWEVATGRLIKKFPGHKSVVSALAFHPNRRSLVSGSYDGVVKLWDLDTGEEEVFRKDLGAIFDIEFDEKGQTLAIGSENGLLLCQADDPLLIQRLKNRSHLNREFWAANVSWSPAQHRLASGDNDKTVKLWDVNENRLVCSLEGHTDAVVSVDFIAGGQILASKGRAEDSTIRLWDCNKATSIGIIRELTGNYWYSGLAFHPTLPLLAAVGSEPGTPYQKGGKSKDNFRDRVIHIYELDLPTLLGQVSEPVSHYLNAKVVLLGDTGVGKSGLSLVLNNQPFAATDSTPGRRVWTLESNTVELQDIQQTREILLWDLAGQPGYRVIHQLHLKEVAVALVVFDARSETDPLAGVRHWERALRLAQQRDGAFCVPMKKFLVSARNDRGTVSVSKERLRALIDEFKFDGYFETSAKEGWKIEELQNAIRRAIEWDKLPEVTSSQLFTLIKGFLLEVKKTGHLLAPVTPLYEQFVLENPRLASETANLRKQFDTCVGRLENRDLIRRLTFGGYLLLQPELLDAYGSAMVNAAKEEPDGLGSLPEEIALAGRFYVPKEQKIADLNQEQLLLHATIEELVRHDLALRENADDGRYLVFPSQFNRDYEDAPEPKGKAVAVTFDGPVQSLYSTLAVRLGHSGLFTTGRSEMWRNAAVFTAKAGGKCGLFLQEFAEGRGRLILFYPDDRSSAETRYHFEEFVVAHAQRRALENTVELVRFFVCSRCGDPVPDSYVNRLRERGKLEFECPCGAMVSLAEPKERIHFRSKVEAMDKAADRQRDFEAFVMSAKGETSSQNFRTWAGGDEVTLAIVFTDVVGSTALGEAIRDEAMTDVRRAHFAYARKLIRRFQGREIKTIGDSFMAAFKCVGEALDFAQALHHNSGHPHVHIRAGIHIGPMQIEEGDVFGGTVNFAARVVGAIPEAEVWLSERAKEDIDRLGASKHKSIQWKCHEDVTMKGFHGKFRLWAAMDPAT